MSERSCQMSPLEIQHPQHMIVCHDVQSCSVMGGAASALPQVPCLKCLPQALYHLTAPCSVKCVVLSVVIHVLQYLFEKTLWLSGYILKLNSACHY